MKDNKVAIIGCGNIGTSLLQGFLKDKTIPAGNFIVTRKFEHELESLKGLGINLTTDNVKAVKESNIIIIAVKPYNIMSVLDEIKNTLNPDKHILVSITAGIMINDIKNALNIPVPLFRVMPNISSSVGKSVSCICSSDASSKDVKTILTLFDEVGTTMLIGEELMQSATILGSCGIAYVLRFVRAMIQGGIQIGFDAKTASTIVTQTVKGAAELLIERQEHPEYEIDKVTTPKGCTIVGLNEMEHNGFSSSLIKGIVASYEKIEK
jgi:pyrroline-5-carboxylate reductase